MSGKISVPVGQAVRFVTGSFERMRYRAADRIEEGVNNSEDRTIGARVPWRGGLRSTAYWYRQG
jgi:hypothetical protein